MVKNTVAALLAMANISSALGVMAYKGNNLDLIYKYAYETTMMSLRERSQDSINLARVAISRLPKELDWAKGEFSKQVDTVQHPILVKIVNAISKAQKEKNQTSINEARKAIPYNLTEDWKNSYSSAIDKVQQEIIDKASELLDKCKNSLTEKGYKELKDIIEDIKKVENNDTVKTWVESFEKTVEKCLKFDISYVRVLTPSEIEIKFNHPISSSTINENSIRAYGKGDSTDRLFINKVTKIYNDTIRVSFFDKFVSDKEYEVELNDVKDIIGQGLDYNKSRFRYTEAKPGNIEVKKTTLPSPKQGEIVSLKDHIVVRDTQGRDITEDSELEFESSDLAIVDQNGNILKSGNVIIVVKVKGTNIRTQEMIIKVIDEVESSYQGFTIANDTNIDQISRKKYSELTSNEKINYVLLGEVNQKLVLFYKDQFGKERTGVFGEDINVVRNYNPGNFILGDDGVIKPISIGTGSVKVKVGDKEQTLSIQVKAERKESTLNVDKNSLSLAKNSKISEEIYVDIKDQYGRGYEVNKDDVKLDIRNGKGEYVALSQVENKASQAVLTQEADKSKFKLKINAAKDKTGYDYYRLSYEKNGVKLYKYITVNIRDTAGFRNYVVEPTSATLDYNVNNKERYPQSTKIRVYEVDSNGLRLKEAENVTYEVVDKNAPIEVNNGVVTLKDNPKPGSYKVKVNIDSLERIVYINIKDSTPKPTSIVFNNKAGYVTKGGTIYDVLGTVDFDVKDQSGNKIYKPTISNVKWLPANEVNVNVKADDSGERKFTLIDESKPGEAEVVITSITVNENEVKLPTPVVIKVKVKIK